MKIIASGLISFLALLSCKHGSLESSQVEAASSGPDVPKNCYSVWTFNSDSPDTNNREYSQTNVSAQVTPLYLPAAASDVCFEYNGTLSHWVVYFNERAEAGRSRHYDFTGNYEKKPAKCRVGKSSKSCAELKIGNVSKKFSLFFSKSSDGNWHMSFNNTVDPQYTLLSNE